MTALPVKKPVPPIPAVNGAGGTGLLFMKSVENYGKKNPEKTQKKRKNLLIFKERSCIIVKH